LIRLDEFLTLLKLQMNSNMYGQPPPGMTGPNPGGMMGGPGPMPGPPPPGANPMQMNPYAPPPNGPGPGMHHQQHPAIGPHHPHQLQPTHQPMMPYNGVPTGHTISMPPQSYSAGPSPVMNSNNYQLPKRNRRF